MVRKEELLWVFHANEFKTLKWLWWYWKNPERERQTLARQEAPPRGGGVSAAQSLDHTNGLGQGLEPKDRAARQYL